jgi:FkbM family methyltransferase
MAAGPGSRVIAFEPNPEMTKRLARNVALNDLEDSVQIEGCALGAATGDATLNLRRRNFGEASLLPIAAGASDGTLQVPLRPLADFTKTAGDHDVSLLKIDVEGAEEAVLLPLLNAGGWLPDAMLVETKHADQCQSDLAAQIIKAGYETRMKVEGNTLFTRIGQKR